LNKALVTMHTNKMYKRLVFYLEACESGSMFDGQLPANVNIYATTAANPDESSYGTYCSPADMVDGKEIGSCLGDEYSIHWMEDADQQGPQETLGDQFTHVQNLTVESHVMQYGDVSWQTEKTGDFEGENPTLLGSKKPHRHAVPFVAAPAGSNTKVNSRDIKLHTHYYAYLRAARGSEARTNAYAQLLDELQQRSDADDLFEKLATAFSAVTGVEAEDLSGAAAMPVVCDTCCKMANAAVLNYCGGYTDYSLQFTNVVVNACASQPIHNQKQAGFNLAKAIKATCA